MKQRKARTIFHWSDEAFAKLVKYHKTATVQELAALIGCDGEGVQCTYHHVRNKLLSAGLHAPRNYKPPAKAVLIESSAASVKPRPLRPGEPTLPPLKSLEEPMYQVRI